jgi:tRNA-dihydrouridine synthase B
MKIPLTLGSLALKSCYLLSPLEGVSCVGFRQLCHRNGAGLTFTEMVRAQGILRNNAATIDLIDTFDESTPTGLQLLTKSSKELEATLRRLESLSEDSKWVHLKNICAVDVNFGCPSPDVIREGAGPALLKRKKVLSDLFAVLVAWKNSCHKLPNIKAVGCKIRLGLNADEQNHKVYLSVAELAANAGLDWITVHARHAKQKSSDMPTWAAIGDVVNATSVIAAARAVDESAASNRMKVIGNGNVKDFASANLMADSTNCDGFMIARAAIRNPWIFQQLNADDSGERWPTVDEVKSAKEAYSVLAHKYSSKPKFVKFHDENFSRILRAAESGDLSQPYRHPKTIHL